PPADRHHHWDRGRKGRGRRDGKLAFSWRASLALNDGKTIRSAWAGKLDAKAFPSWMTPRKRPLIWPIPRFFAAMVHASLGRTPEPWSNRHAAASSCRNP